MKCQQPARCKNMKIKRSGKAEPDSALHDVRLGLLGAREQTPGLDVVTIVN